MLVVNDEPSRTELLRMALRYEGWAVRTEGEARAAVRCVREWRPDVLVLDVTPGSEEGAEGGAQDVAVAARVRRELPDVPALFLVGRDADAGVGEKWLAGLCAGGDVCVTEPFGVDEVVAGLRTLLHRKGPLRERPERAGSLLVVGDLELDEESRVVSRGGDGIRLTATEFELLRYLMRNPRRVLSKAQILSRVWNYDFGGQANVVELYISYLRRKVDAGRTPMIHTRRGEGYVLRSAEPVQSDEPVQGAEPGRPGQRDGRDGRDGRAERVGPGGPARRAGVARARW